MSQMKFLIRLDDCHKNQYFENWNKILSILGKYKFNVKDLIIMNISNENQRPLLPKFSTSFIEVKIKINTDIIIPFLISAVCEAPM